MAKVTLLLAVLSGVAVACGTYFAVEVVRSRMQRDRVPSVDAEHPLWMDREGRVWTAERGGKMVSGASK